MKTIQISELKVGDKLPDSEPTKYGHYTNIEIASINLTKGGRYLITINRVYNYYNNRMTPEKEYESKYSNGALVGTNLIQIL